MDVFEMGDIILTVSITGGSITKWLKRNLETIAVLEPSECLGASTDEPFSLDAYVDRLENQLAKQKKHTR